MNQTDNAPLTQDEIRDLQAVIPDAVIAEPGGQLYSKLDRAEALALVQRYPSMFPGLAGQQRASPGADPVLAARYPSMF